MILDSERYLRNMAIEIVLDPIENYAENGGPGAVRPSCSFYHDPLRHQLLYLV